MHWNVWIFQIFKRPTNPWWCRWTGVLSRPSFSTWNKVHDVTKAEIIVMSGGAVLYSTFEEGLTHLSSATLGSEDFSVYQVEVPKTPHLFFYRRTRSGDLLPNLFLRQEGASISDAGLYAAFIGIIFLVFSVTTVSSSRRGLSPSRFASWTN
jgi:hypothetical protein